MLFGFDKLEVSPPGWSGTTKAMKRHKNITNPWALSWWMKNQGYKPHKKPEKSKKSSREHKQAASVETQDISEGKVTTLAGSFILQDVSDLYEGKKAVAKWTPGCNFHPDAPGCNVHPKSGLHPEHHAKMEKLSTSLKDAAHVDAAVKEGKKSAGINKRFIEHSHEEHEKRAEHHDKLAKSHANPEVAATHKALANAHRDAIKIHTEHKEHHAKAAEKPAHKEELKKEAPKELPKDEPKKEIPKEVPKEIPKEAPKAEPASVATPKPAETPAEKSARIKAKTDALHADHPVRKMSEEHQNMYHNALDVYSNTPPDQMTKALSKRLGGGGYSAASEMISEWTKNSANPDAHILQHHLRRVGLAHHSTEDRKPDNERVQKLIDMRKESLKKDYGVEDAHLDRIAINLYASTQAMLAKRKDPIVVHRAEYGKRADDITASVKSGAPTAVSYHSVNSWSEDPAGAAGFASYAKKNLPKFATANMITHTYKADHHDVFFHHENPLFQASIQGRKGKENTEFLKAQKEFMMLDRTRTVKSHKAGKGMTTLELV